jgi:hypothetical protein
LLDFDEPLKESILYVPRVKKYSICGMSCWSKSMGSF